MSKPKFDFFGEEDSKQHPIKTKYFDGSFIADELAELIHDALKVAHNQELSNDQKNKAMTQAVLGGTTKIIIGLHERGILK